MSNRTPLYGSFLGFTFNNQHSSTLGIVRTNSSNRMAINLLPTLKDVSTQIDSDVAYFLGSTYTKREIIIPFAFDDLTEEGIRHIKQIFKDNKIHDLILDEEPYKIWSAKMTGTSVLKHLCFEEIKDGSNIRHYRGEGSYSFTCYFCFARSRFNYREDYIIANIPEWIDIFSSGGGGSPYDPIDPSSKTDAAKIYYEIPEEWTIDPTTFTAVLRGEATQFDWVDEQWLKDVVDIEPVGNGMILVGGDGKSIYVNYDEWIEASDLPSKKEYGFWENNNYKLYNAGDIPMPVKIWYKLPDSDGNVININISCNGETIKASNIKRLNLGDGIVDKYVAIDTYKHVIEGYDEDFKATNHLYNQYLNTSQFFKVGLGDQIITKTDSTDRADLSIEFNYLYL